MMIDKKWGLYIESSRKASSRRGREGHILPDNGGRVGRLEVGTFSLDGVRSWRFLKR